MTDETPITLEKVKNHPLIDVDEYLQWAVAEIVRLQAESAKYRKALEHYADKSNWGNHWAASGGMSLYLAAYHGYRVAEEALRET